MMKLTVLLLLIITQTSLAQSTTPLHQLRSLYREASQHEEKCRQLSTISVPEKGSHVSAMKGYKAAATMMMAKYVFNPLSKISYFRKGKDMLEKAILADGKNVELRFLRYTIQTNAPSFLGYNKSVSTDRQYLLKSLPQITDPALKNMIVSYLNTNKA